MDVAVIADIHGNLPALEAVLEEVDREPHKAIVVGGDVASGPFPGPTLDRLMQLERARFVRGNADREMVEAFDEGRAFDPDEEDPSLKAGPWAAERITQLQRDFLASFEEHVVMPVEGLGAVLFCHGSPGSDEDIMTSLTPDPSLRRMLAGVEQRVVVCGHTHIQFDRALGEVRVLNTGSVGMPYEGRRGAFWLALGPDVAFRCTEYDQDAAGERILASDYWDAEELVRDILLNPPDPREIEEFFERLAAQRGERGQGNAS
jgi:putative phosphoesterase